MSLSCDIFWQAIFEIYETYRHRLSEKCILILTDSLHDVAIHTHKTNTNFALRLRLQELGSVIQMQDPPLLRLENEAYQLCLTFLQNLVLDRPQSQKEGQAESYLVDLCRKILEFYIETAASEYKSESAQLNYMIPLDSGKRKELAARAPVVVATLQAISRLGETSFEKYLADIFPLLASLISCEHGSNEVQAALGETLSSTLGPVLIRLSSTSCD